MVDYLKESTTRSYYSSLVSSWVEKIVKQRIPILLFPIKSYAIEQTTIRKNVIKLSMMVCWQYTSAPIDESYDDALSLLRVESVKKMLFVKKRYRDGIIDMIINKGVAAISLQ